MMLLEPGGDERVMEPILQVFRDPGTIPTPLIYKALLHFLYLKHHDLVSVYVFPALPKLTLHPVSHHG